MPVADPATAATLGARLAALIGRDAAAQDRFGIAVSGGADSLALLRLAADAMPGRIAAATVDHQLREESATEAAHVAAICASINVPHTTLVPDAPITGSLQAAARTARYGLLDQWRQAAGLDWIITAHHADDQLETMAMRLARGSGVGGLAGIRAQQGRVLRPLLMLRRDDLSAVVRAAGWTAVDDPSNTDSRFDRARWRTALARLPELDAIAASNSAQHLAAADDALDWIVTQMAAAALAPQDDGWTLMIDVDWPQEIQHRLWIAALRRAQPDIALRAGALDRLAAALRKVPQASIGALLVRVTGPGRWWIGPAGSRDNGG